jgi:septum formation inhibitor-activating ATPase MinD
MDSGKTTTAACIAHGLKQTGKRVAFMKFTGTVHTKDRDYVYDAGADAVTDFSDMGFPSTFMRDKQELLDLYQSLLAKLSADKPDFILVEIADGLLQRETNFLLWSQEFMSTINSVVFSCGDSLSAFQGIDVLNEMHITPSFISGRFTMSPLLIQEVQEHSGMPVLDMFQILSGEFNHLLISRKMVAA